MTINGWHRLWIVASFAWGIVLAMWMSGVWLPAVVADDWDLVRTLLVVWVLSSIAMLGAGYGVAWTIRGFRSRAN